MFSLKWICLITVMIWMGGTNFSGCEGCEDECTQAQMDTSMAWEDWQAAEQAYETAVNNGENQQTIDQLNSERMQAQTNHQNSVTTMQLICGG